MARAASTFPHPLYDKFVLRPALEDARNHYYEPMLSSNRAHIVMLLRCGIISHDNAKAVLNALGEIERDGVDALQVEAGVEDLFFAMERRLIALAGEAFGGNLQLARSRNDLGYALTRLALRPKQLATVDLLLALRRSLHAFAHQHLETLMPGHTHTQPAQPTTMAHYIAGVLALLQRDTTRLRAAHAVNNQSPLGAAALTGTGFAIDRELSASLLGFDSVQDSTWDSIGASDNLTDSGGALVSLGVNLSRFTRDMLFWATQESGAIRIDDSFIQISSIMPQKRNPVALEHLRARISRMLALANGIALQCHNIPFGDTQDIEDEILPLLFGSLDAASEILQLYAVVIDTLQVNVDHLRSRAGAGFTTVTELADTLVRECRLPFRQAHGIVSALVNYASDNGLEAANLDAAMLREIASREFDLALDLPEDEFQRALDAWHFVLKRDGHGGAAPTATANVLDAQLSRIDEDRAWLSRTRDRLEEADMRLQNEVDKIISAEDRDAPNESAV